MHPVLRYKFVVTVFIVTLMLTLFTPTSQIHKSELDVECAIVVWNHIELGDIFGLFCRGFSFPPIPRRNPPPWDLPGSSNFALFLRLLLAMCQDASGSVDQIPVIEPTHKDEGGIRFGPGACLLWGDRIGWIFPALRARGRWTGTVNAHQVIGDLKHPIGAVAANNASQVLD